MFLNKTAILAGNMKLNTLTLGMRYNNYPEEKETGIIERITFRSKNWISKPIRTNKFEKTND